MPKRTNKRVETIVYKEIAFRRYPESKNWSDANYFRPNSVWIKKGIGHLHREIWKDNMGPIPEGYEIHHKDNNPSNNELGNLEMLTAEQHRILNAQKSEGWKAQARERIERNREKLNEGRRIWEESEEAFTWHSEHAKNQWEQRQFKTYVCQNCGNSFESKTIEEPKFCSNKCKSAARRKSGADNVKRNCVICGKEFEINRYSKTKSCSSECTRKLISKPKRKIHKEQ